MWKKSALFVKNYWFSSTHCYNMILLYWLFLKLSWWNMDFFDDLSVKKNCWSGQIMFIKKNQYKFLACEKKVHFLLKIIDFHQRIVIIWFFCIDYFWNWVDEIWIFSMIWASKKTAGAGKLCLLRKTNTNFWRVKKKCTFC